MEGGVKESFKNLVTGRLKWAGHGKRKGSDRLAKRADAQNMERERRRGRPR